MRRPSSGVQTMTLPLTPEMLAAAYDFLLVTKPFCDWNLEDSEDVKFVVGKFRNDYAQYQWDGKRHVITISAHGIGYTRTLFEKLSHELIHLHLENTGMESRTGGKDTHNAAFRKFAARVCRYHGFDPKAFY